MTKDKEKKINPVKVNLEKEIANRGLEMSKLISESVSGFFYYKPATYDRRTVYSKEDLYKLTKEGFLIDSDFTCLLLDAILKL